MSASVTVTDLHFILTPQSAARDDGLLGWVSVTLAGVVRIDGIAVRRARGSDDLIVSWPSRRDDRGRSHAIALPLTAVRNEVNRAILDEVRAVLQRCTAHEVKPREAKS